MKVGYIRVSTQEQNEARQKEAMRQQGIDDENMFIDKMSGKDAARPELQRMLGFIRRGDIVVVESISRAARNVRDLLKIVDTIIGKGADFISLKESIDTSSPQGKFMLTVFAAMAELERDTILQRQAEGIAIAKAEGKYKGRQPVKVDAEAFKAQYQEWKAGKQTARATMANLGLKQRTFYRLVEEYEGRADRAVHKGI